ncbi:MAG: DNA primase [Pirellulales bacterium]
MATVPVDVKEQVKQSIDIVDLIGGHLSLQRKGRKFVAHCPWHDDRRPSLQIDPERQSFKCFVCDIGGDVFSFVMRMENVEFREALSLLAERAGISLGGSGGAPSEKLREVRDVVAWARERFHEFLLRDSAAEPARRYLAERRLEPETWQQFQLGFSPPSWDWLLRAGQRASLAPEALESVGLVVRREDTGRVYDRFRGRLLFPICDQRGIPVGFGGRVLPALVADQGEATGAKYINSPESPLFTKSKLLYALDAAHREFQARREAIVVEGYTDCLMAHQFGIRNTVAVLGTALGGEHIRLLRRLVDRVVLVLDGDAAGQRRTNEVLNLFVAAKFDLRVATLPEGLDPCDFLVQRGPDAFRELIESAHDALDHKIAAELTAVRGQDSVHASQQAVENILATLAMVEPGGDAEATATRLREEHALHRVATRFGLSDDVLRRRLAALRKSPRLRQGRLGEVEPVAVESRAIRMDAWDRDLLEILVHHPECLDLAQQHVAPGQLRSELGRLIYQTSCDLAEAGETPTLARLMLELESPAVRKLLVDLDEGGRAKDLSDWKALMAQYAKRLEDFRRHCEVKELREGKLGESEQLSALQEVIARKRANQPTKKTTPSDEK